MSCYDVNNNAACIKQLKRNILCQKCIFKVTYVINIILMQYDKFN